MKDCIDNKNPMFPAIDITYENWESIDLNRVMWTGKFLFSLSDESYYHYAHEHKLFDCLGNIYIIEGRKSVARWRQWVPFMRWVELVFRSTGERLELEEVKNFFFDKIDTLNEEYINKHGWKEQVKNAINIQEVIMS